MTPNSGPATALAERRKKVWAISDKIEAALKAERTNDAPE